jgi:SDR family mycofactocin-dependent oxidoreductase
MGRLDGKVALITGAGQGQGRSHAIRLAEEGASIIATDACKEIHPSLGYRWPTEHDLAETRALVEKSGSACVTAIADVRDRAALQAAVDLGLAEFGYLDVVVANAGIMTFHHNSLVIPDDIYDVVMDVNLKGVWNTLQAAVPAMISSERLGSIIITSSAAGIRGQVGYAHYTASKHGVVGLMKTFSNELAQHRIRVNTIHPTAVGSPGMGSGGPGGAELFASSPLAAATTNTMPDLDSPLDTAYTTIRWIAEREVSQAVLWLASDESRYVTGIQLPVDAGNTTRP